MNPNLSPLNAIAPSPRTSRKYSFIPTTEVIDLLGQKGWTPFKIQEARVNKIENAGFQKHMIRFRHESFQAVQRDQLIPEIVMRNSHDAGASFTFDAGIYRLVCLNGMVVGDSLLQGFKVRHMGFTSSAILTGIEEMTERLPHVMGRVQELKQIEVTRDEQIVFSAAALQLRYDSEELGEKGITLMPERLIIPRRQEDKAPTVWSTLNMVQEGMVEGRGRFIVDREVYGMKKARAITNIHENVKLNKALWTLSEEFAKLKAA